MSETETGSLGGGRIESRELEQEMRTSFLDYAMSVIVSRALPDVRDGLKPVHRRVLYSMWANGNRPGRPYVKSANIVGYVMGNHHPHGDLAIYDTLVRLAQPFSLRYPVVDGQGNFGSIDDDPPAAMRYCVGGRTRVATATGSFPIDSLVPGATSGFGACRRTRGSRSPRSAGAGEQALPFGRPSDTAPEDARGLPAHGNAQPSGALPGRHGRRPTSAVEAPRRGRSRRSRRNRAHASRRSGAAEPESTARRRFCWAPSSLKASSRRIGPASTTSTPRSSTRSSRPTTPWSAVLATSTNERLLRGASSTSSMFKS